MTMPASSPVGEIPRRRLERLSEILSLRHYFRLPCLPHCAAALPRHLARLGLPGRRRRVYGDCRFHPHEPAEQFRTHDQRSRRGAHRHRRRLRYEFRLHRRARSRGRSASLSHGAGRRRGGRRHSGVVRPRTVRHLGRLLPHGRRARHARRHRRHHHAQADPGRHGGIGEGNSLRNLARYAAHACQRQSADCR